MKTASLNYPSHTLRAIDTAPLVARYALLCASMMMFIEAGRTGRVLRLSHKIGRLVKTFTRLGRHNILLRRKLDMLSHKPWRDVVLKELGGLRKLKLWEAAQKRIEARKLRPVIPVREEDPSWLHTPERMAESERLKAWARACGRATAHPLIFRDRVKMDFEGEFRLAPLLRGPQDPHRIKIYTAASITEYDWNNIPIAKVEGVGPAMVWPVEFYAAMKAEGEILEERSTPLSPLSSPRKRGPNGKHPSMKLDPLLRGDDKRELGFVPTIPLDQVLSPKEYRYFFGSLTS